MLNQGTIQFYAAIVPTDLHPIHAIDLQEDKYDCSVNGFGKKVQKVPFKICPSTQDK